MEATTCVFALCVLYSRFMRQLTLFALWCSLLPAQDLIESAAKSALTRAAADLALTPTSTQGTYIAKQYKTAHNGITHFVYKQEFQGLEVWNTEWVVNIDASGQVVNSGGQLAPEPSPGLAPAGVREAVAGLTAALQYVNPDLPSGQIALNRKARDGRSYSFSRPVARADSESIGRPVWYLINGALRPAWVFTIVDGTDVREVAVESTTQAIAGDRHLTQYQRAPQARVFTKSSPQPNPTPGVLSTEPFAYVNRETVSLSGDPTASPRGWVAGNSTDGNNVSAVFNPLGILFDNLAQPTRAVDGNFNFPLELGPGQPLLTAYKDAATTNLFYWANRAHDLFHASGFDEASGNFQLDNFGRGGSGGDPIMANAQFGSTNFGGPLLNNAFYTSYGREDGTPSGIHMYLVQDFNNGLVSDGSYDSEVMIHEYAHGVSNRLVRQLDGHQGRAMGEAWSDFFALEFTLPDGVSLDGSHPMGEYFSQLFGAGIRTRPYSTNFAVNPLTYSNLGRVISGPQVHSDGEIWMECLLEVRANLIRQFGEKEGRRRVRLLVIDGMKLATPNPSMVNMRDAILLADRVGFKGDSQDQIWTAFAKRGLGILAQSFSADSTHIVASFEKPSAQGQLRFYEDKYILGETVRVILADGNNLADRATVQLTTTHGDLETLNMRRQGSVFVGTIGTNQFAAPKAEDRLLGVVPTDSLTAFYVDADTGAGPKLIDRTVATGQEYTAVLGLPPIPTGSGTETRLFNVVGRGVIGSALVNLPFAFPFYGNTYKTLRVYGDGLIAFDIPNIFGCKDLPTLQRINGIAPLWMELAYGGNAQANENVYVSRGPGSVTFRWAAETQRTLLAPPLGQAAEPVNFTTTLFDDGRIQTSYGEGNRNLNNDFRFVYAFGCQTSTPVVALSSGHETQLIGSATHNGRTSMAGVPSLTWLPPFGNSTLPAVVIESPSAGGKAAGILNLRGVAWDDSGFSPRLDLLVDGTAVGRAFINTLRPDFCAQQRVTGCPGIGFSSNLNMSALGIKPGPHTLQLRASNFQGGFTDSALVNFEVEAAAPAVVTGRIEAPTDGAEITGQTIFRGWVHAGPIRITAVDSLIDGISNGAAIYNQPRPDVCTGLTPLPVNCPAVGFQYLFDPILGIQTVAPGRHTLQFRARDDSGRLTLFPETPVSFTIPGTPNRVPTGALETPVANATLRGTVTVRGWAYDPDGTVTSARLIVNGVVQATFRLVEPRPDICATLPNVRACPNIGFETTLDTTLLRNGLNSLYIQVFDNAAGSVNLPLTSGTGINVFVGN